MKKYVFIPLLVLPIVFLQAQADEMDALSKELINPIGMKWKLNNFIEIDRISGNANEDDAISTVWNMQPVMPVMLGETGYTLMNRPSLPIYLNKPIPKNAEINDISGIGDLTLQSSIGKMPKVSWGSYMWGAGVGLTLPIASRDELGTGKYSAGPSGMLVGFT
ncbi:MAG: hypothetical protein JKY50_03800 [Oleispira sp.]|nr:hypothetical protein [Oleispira sp.]